MSNKAPEFKPKGKRQGAEFSDRVQVYLNIRGPLAVKFTRVRDKLDITSHDLAVQCIEFALKHMDGALR